MKNYKWRTTINVTDLKINRLQEGGTVSGLWGKKSRGGKVWAGPQIPATAFLGSPMTDTLRKFGTFVTIEEPGLKCS